MLSPADPIGVDSPAQAVALLLGVGLGLLVAQAPVDPDRGDDPEVEDMVMGRSGITARAALDLEALSTNFTMYLLNGTVVDPMVNPDEYARYLPRGDGLDFKTIDIRQAYTSAFGGMNMTHFAGTTPADYYGIPIENRAANNLGGMGPNNGTYRYRRAVTSLPYYDAIAAPDGNYNSHPNFIRMNDVTSNGGRRVGLRVDNTSEYKGAKPAMNDFNGFNFQVNLAPIYDPYGGDPARSAAHDPFRDTSVPYGNLINQFIESALKVNLGQENSNAVSLFYSFFHQDDGSPVELSEVRTPSLPLPPRLSPR